MRDKAKEEELRKSGEAKYFHFNDDLHVLTEVFAPPQQKPMPGWDMLWRKSKSSPFLTIMMKSGKHSSRN